MSSAEASPYTPALVQETPRERKRHRAEQQEKAYKLQRNAAIWGAFQWTVIGASAVFMCHHLFPGFRRQTLALKGHIVSGATIFGLVTSADKSLLSHESQERHAEEEVRRAARVELSKKGMIATETDIEKYAKRLEAEKAAARAEREE